MEATTGLDNEATVLLCMFVLYVIVDVIDHILSERRDKDYDKGIKFDDDLEF